MIELHVRTPLLQSDPLESVAGTRIWLKMESFQPSGSFKNRGMGAACRCAVEAGATEIVCSSGGNAGLAVAYAGRKLGVPVTIVVPQSTAERARDLIRAQRAEVRIHGAAWDDAHQYALQLCHQGGGAYIHPFDDPVVWSGHAGLIDEIVEQGLEFDLVVVAVGGGGLLCGIMQGLARHGLADLPVLALETEGAASLHRSVLAGRLIELDRIDSIATTLGARQVAPRAFEHAQRPNLKTATVTDAQALEACLRFARDHRVLVEPACGAALAAVYGAFDPVSRSRSVLVIVCGGAGVDIPMLEAWRQRLL